MLSLSCFCQEAYGELLIPGFAGVYCPKAFPFPGFGIEQLEILKKNETGASFSASPGERN
jgi:hypothetical protein